MLSALIFGVFLALIAAHEYLAWRGRPTSRFSVGRRLALLALVGVAAALGSRVGLEPRIQSVLDGWRKKEAVFDAGGDPMLSAALDGQRPDRAFPASGSADDARAWQSYVSERLRVQAQLSGVVPTDVTFRVLSAEDVGTVRRTLIAFDADDGTRIPAFVHEPRDQAPRAGVLVIPGHGGGIRATAGITPDYQHSAARSLAERGYVTLTAELRGFGLLAPGGVAAHRAVAEAALVAGTFYKGIVARDLVRALTLLQRWPGVDPARVAVAGASLGGELAVFLAAIDQRPRVIISHSYGGSVGPESANEEATDDVRQTPHGCHTVPGVNRLLHREQWFALLAPRAVQVVRGRENVGQRADAFQTLTTRAFEQLSAPDRFQFRIVPGGHEFFLEAAADFLAKWL
jgi:dienelactone hydrolase